MHDDVRVPVIRISSLVIRCVNPFFVLVRGWVQDLFFFELLGDLHRAATFHAEIKDVPDDLRRFLIHDPFLWILRIFPIAVRNVRCQVLTAFAFGLVDRSNLPAGVAGVELVEPVADSGKVIVDTVSGEKLRAE